MGWWSKSNDKEILKNSSLQRCKKILDQAENGIKTHSFWEKTWTIIHLCLGLSISFSSTLSVIFIFSQSSNISIGFSMISAVLGGFMSFLNPPPSVRAKKNQIIKNKYKRLDTKILDTITEIHLKYKTTKDNELIQLVKNLSETLGEI